MRRAVLALFVLVCHTAPAVQSSQTAPPATDGIGRLLAQLETAIESGRVENFRTIAAPAISGLAVDRFVRTSTEPVTDAIVRERTRRPGASSMDVVADVLVSHGANGRIATWQLTASPDPNAPGEYRIADLRELAAVEGLVKLRLDTTRQFSVKDLTIDAPDLKLTMSSGTAFVAESRGGVTALVLRGDAELTFTPPDPAEQLQLEIFSRRKIFRTDVDTVFVRVNPAEFALRVSEASLSPAPIDAREAARAQEVFDEYSPRTFNLDVSLLTSERWSLEPAYGSLILEFKTSRHGWLTYTRSPWETEDISLFDRDSQHNICQYASASHADRARVYSDDDGAAYDVEHYDVSASFDPRRNWIAGRGTLRIRVMTVSVATVTIKLAQALVVSSVSSRELGELLALRVTGQNQLLIGLPEPAVAGSRLTFEITYAGRLLPQQISNELIAAQSQIPPPAEGLIVTPEPRYIYSNRVAWYPQGLASDYATARLRLSVPAEYQVLATGRQIGSSEDEAESGGRRRTSDFVADRPVRYLACLIARMEPVGRTVVDVPAVAPAATDLAGPPTSVMLEVLSTSRMASRNRETADQAAAMVRFYAETIGEAPYPHLSIGVLDDNLPGGHSPPYLIALHQALPTTPYVWSSDPVSFENQFPPFFLAHEVAHQWWGQAVGWRNYHEQWLSEGLAQYFAALFAAADRGPDLLDALIKKMRETSQSELDQGPISLGYRIGHIRNDGRAFRSILYNKAAVVLHMLRRFIGDEAFFGGLRRFYADRRFSKAGTDQLQAAFEAGTTLSLDRFFDKWVRGFTMPRIRFTWREADAGATAVVRVEQDEADVFDFPLTVEVQYRDGGSEFRTLPVVGSAFEMRLPVSGPLRRVEVKDDLTYFKKR